MSEYESGSSRLLKYYETLGLSPYSSKEQVKKEFLSLSRKYHPDSSTGDRKKYYEITEAYDYLTKGNNSFREYGSSEESEDDSMRSTSSKFSNRSRSLYNLGSSKANSTEFSLKSPKVFKEYYQPLSKKIVKSDSKRTGTRFNTLLTYTLKLNWGDVLKTWVQNQPYKKEFKYYYEKECTCEQLCTQCKGASCNPNYKRFCKECKNEGVVHYCENCEGTGITKLRDSCQLVIPPGQQPPETFKLPHKGNVISNTEIRQPLVIRPFFESSSVKRKRNSFLFERALTVSDIIENREIKIQLVPNRGILIQPENLSRIPYTIDVSSFFQNVYLNSENIKCYMKLYLDLTERSF